MAAATVSVQLMSETLEAELAEHWHTLGLVEQPMRSVAFHPHPRRVRLEGLPEEVRGGRRHCVWRFDWIANRQEWSKVPYQPNGRKAMSNTPSTWATLKECWAAYNAGGWNGIGLIGRKDPKTAFVDLDKCRDPESGALDPRADEIVAELSSYTEVSPSGRGLRILVYGEKPPGSRCRVPYFDDGHFELYDHTNYQFCTLTGDRINDVDRLAHVDLAPLCLRLFGPVLLPPRNGAAGHGIEDDRLLELMRDRGNGFAALYDDGDLSGHGGDESSADLALCNLLAYACGPAGLDQADRLFRRSALMRPKWDERRGQSTYGAGTLARAYTREDDSPRTDYYGGTKPAKKLTLHGLEGEPERVTWLWKGWLPRGKLCVQDGDPGKGKSTILLDLAARSTTGAVMPDGSPGLEGGGFVLLLMAEDGRKDTIIPRLIAAGADRSRVMALEPSEVQIPRDVPRLEEAIRDTRAVAVFFDPLNFYLGDDSVNTNSDKQVRVAMTPLVEMAERTGTIIIGNRHLNKGGTGPAIYRGMGSIGIGGLARSVWCVADEPDGGGFIFASVKLNLARRPQSLRYTIGEIHLSTGSVSRIEWGGSSSLTADDILGDDPAEAGALVSATRALEELLTPLGADGMAVDDLKGWAKSEMHSWRTLQRAHDSLGVLSVKQGFTCWTWVLPPKGARVTR